MILRPDPQPQDRHETLYRGYPIMSRYVDRFHTKYDRQLEDPRGCWNWTGSVNSQGIPTYGIGKHGLDQKNLVIAAYKFAFVLEYGNHWSNFAIKRTCGNLICVNPNHFYVERALAVKEDEQALRICMDDRCEKTISLGNKNEMCLPCTIRRWVERDSSTECDA